MRVRSMSLEEVRANRGVLLVGWKLPLLISLQRLGVPVSVVVEGGDAEKAHQVRVASRVHVTEDAGSAERVLATLMRAGSADAGYMAVCGCQETTVVSAAIVGALLGVEAMPVATSVALRDKFIQKQLVREAGLRVTDFRVVEDARGLTDIEWAGDVVIKPISGAGTVDTHRVSLKGELPVTDWEAGPLLVERFVEGREIQIDGIVRRGKVTWLGVSEYLSNVIDIQRGGLVGNVALRPSRNRGIYSEAEGLASTALRGIGHQDGVFHMEVFRQLDGLIFSECAGRISGGGVAETLQLMFDVDLYSEWGRAIIGMRPDAGPGPAEKEVYGTVRLGMAQGVVLAMPDRDTILGIPGVVRVELSIGVGDTMGDQASDSAIKCGSAVVVGGSEAEVADKLESLARWFVAQCRVDGTESGRTESS